MGSLTLILQVAQVQDGGQELGDLPVLCVGEHEHLHGRADVGVLLAVLPALACGTVTLVSRGGRVGHRRVSVRPWGPPERQWLGRKTPSARPGQPGVAGADFTS